MFVNLFISKTCLLNKKVYLSDSLLQDESSIVLIIQYMHRVTYVHRYVSFNIAFNISVIFL